MYVEGFDNLMAHATDPGTLKVWPRDVYCDYKQSVARCTDNYAANERTGTITKDDIKCRGNVDWPVTYSATQGRDRDYPGERMTE